MMMMLMMMQYDDDTDQRSRVHSEASLILEILEDTKDNQHKAQISSIMFIIY